MKSGVILMAALAALSGGAHAAHRYDSYDEFYAAQPGAVFGAPVAQEAGSVYSHPGEQSIYMHLRSALDGKAVRIDVAENRITVNGKTYRFTRATMFPDEHAVDVYPAGTKVFLAAGTSNRPSAMCVEGDGSGSGEADRHKQIFLLLDPLARRTSDQIMSREILVPSSETPAIRPALVRTNASTGLVAVDVSILPFAPTRTTATVASTPAAHPWLPVNLSSASCVMNSMTIAFDCAPICNPNEAAATL
jgi:hypothetical protein